MARLPIVGGDDGDWGTILNEYLAVGHDSEGNNLFSEQATDVVITVGSGGDYATLNEGLAAAKRLRKAYVFRGVQIEVRQLAGFVMAEQVFVVQDDLSFITLTSVDAEVTITRSAINQGNGNSTNNWRTGTFPAFCAMRGASLPFIKTLYSFDTSGTGEGTVVCMSLRTQER